MGCNPWGHKKLNTVTEHNNYILIVNRTKASLNLGKILVPEIFIYVAEGREITYDNLGNKKQKSD